MLLLLSSFALLAPLFCMLGLTVSLPLPVCTAAATGVILNMAFPSWLLALLWVVFMAGSNVELAWSIYRMFQIRSQLKQYSPQLLHLNWDGAAGVAGHHTHQAAAGRSGATDTAAAGAGDVGTAAAGAADAGAAAHVAVPVKDAAAAAAGPATSGELLQKLKQLRDQAEKVESIALLYPAFYIPSAQQLLDKHNITLEKGNLLGSSMSSKLLLVEQEAVMLQALQEQRSGSSRFTWKWGPWWKLQNHFEMMLVLKVVVLHLVTEGVRHHTTKPCSKRFWMMLFVATGLVTAFLIFIVTAYSRRRLWRGPHWVDALAVVTQQKKSERSRKAGSGASGSAASSAEATMTIQEEDAVVAGPSSRSSSRAGQAAGGEAAAAGAAADKPRGCCGKCKKRLPWVWVTAPEAITNVSACNSRDQYRSWQVPRLLTAAAGAQAVGIFASALGLPAGPTMAYLMLMLGLKPHVVAGSSRFLVLCFCFGVFVAYIIAGNLHRQLALAFGLLNLGLAPLGMLLFRKLNWQTHVLLIMSLVMGTVGMVCIIVWQLVPLLAYLAGTEQHLPYRMANSAVKESIIRSGNTFQLMRFCLGTVY